MGSRHVFIQRIADKRNSFLSSTFLWSRYRHLNDPNVSFVLFCFTLYCPGISEKYRLTKIVCYVFSVLLFFEDNQLNVFMT